MISLQELATFSSLRSWTLTGENAIVKAVSVEDANIPAGLGTAAGYVTQAKFLKNLNALQIESGLGLRPHSLKKGCYIFYFKELPNSTGVDQKFNADMPDGKIWDEKSEAAFYKAKEKAKYSGSDLVDFYPPGSSKIMQWKLKRPFSLSGMWKLVTVSIPFEI